MPRLSVSAADLGARLPPESPDDVADELDRAPWFRSWAPSRALPRRSDGRLDFAAPAVGDALSSLLVATVAEQLGTPAPWTLGGFEDPDSGEVLLLLHDERQRQPNPALLGSGPNLGTAAACALLLCAEARRLTGLEVAIRAGHAAPASA
jgi:hypothetical protein